MGGSQRYCVECGHELRPGGRFCTVCGRAAGNDSGQAAVAGRGAGEAPPPGDAGQAPAAAGQAPAATGQAPPPGAAGQAPPPGAEGQTPVAGQAPAAAGQAPGEARAVKALASEVPEVPEVPAEPAPASRTWPAATPDWPPGRPGGQASAGPGPAERPLSPAAGAASPDEGRRRRSRWLLAVGLTVLLVGGGAGAAVLLLHSSAKSTASPGASHGPTPATERSASFSATASSSPSAQQQGAEGLAALIAQSVPDRSAAVSAVSDINNCGPSLSQDAQALASAATSRQHLLSRLANLPDRSALSAPMLQALTSAWQASVQADQDYVQWVRDEASRACTPNDHSDSGYRKALGPDGQATAGKKEFVRLWNPLADQYGLTGYKWNQL
jgi:hypothetical protein